MNPMPPIQHDQRRTADDALQPFADSLRERVPSREALLAEAKAMTRQRRTLRNSTLGLLAGVGLLSTLWHVDPAWQTEDVRVAFGQRQQLQLLDGSIVELNSGSHLRIERRLRSRQLELVRGEALFSVVHDDKPFIVRSQGVLVRDIGTVFDVRSDERGVAVGVIQGAVQVSNGTTAPQRLKAGEQLQAGEQLIGPIEAADKDALTAWRYDKLRFNGLPLSEVVSDLQHYRQAPIRIADARTGELRLSGEFDTAGVEILIRLLPTILPVRVQEGADGSVTLNRIR